MTPLHPLRTASAALTLLALLCATTAANAQTPASGWPWGTGFERRHTPATGTQPEPLPDTPFTTGSGAAGNGKSQGTGHNGSGGGRGNGSGSGGGRGR